MTIIDRIINWLERRDLAVARRELNNIREEWERTKATISYLESRDAMVSHMVNTINKQAFEIAQLKGEYK